MFFIAASWITYNSGLVRRTSRSRANEGEFQEDADSIRFSNRSGLVRFPAIKLLAPSVAWLIYSN
jgi:hypothetical protein